MSRVINSKGKENITINKDCTSVRFDIPSVENVFVSSTVARQNVFFFFFWGGGMICMENSSVVTFISP